MEKSMIPLAFLVLAFSAVSADVLVERREGVIHGAEIGYEGRRGLMRSLKRVAVGGLLQEAMLNAAESGDVREVLRLLGAGASPSFVSKDGRTTPLILAAYKDNADVIRVLLSAGAEVGLRNSFGATALETAAEYGSTGAVGVLLAAGADPNEFDDVGLNPVLRASMEGHADVVQALVNAGGDISLQETGDAPGNTALHYAAAGGHLPLVNLLLKLGANVNVGNRKYDQAPLDRAAAQNMGSILLALIKAGADVNHVDIDGESALFTAAFYGNREAVQVLLKNGAEKSVVNHHGDVPRDIVCECKLTSFIPGFCNMDACGNAPRRLIKLLTP